MSQRLVTSFRHTDPAVIPGAHFVFGAGYLPGLEAALHDAQDAHSALLGVQVFPQARGALSSSMGLIRETSRRIHQVLKAGCPR